MSLSDFQISKLMEAFEKLSQKVDAVEQKVDAVSTDLADLRKEFYKNEPNFRKAGTTYELLVLNYLKERKGIDYSRSFTVENLHAAEGNNL